MTEQRTGLTGGHIVLAALSGAVIGAAVALLVAPKTGRETRAMLGDSMRNGRDKVRQVPGALKVAGVAARDAFADAMREEAVV